MPTSRIGRQLRALISPVVEGEADLTIAVPPAQRTADGGSPGGFGLVVNTARRGIADLTGWTPAPHSQASVVSPGRHSSLPARWPLVGGWRWA